MKNSIYLLTFIGFLCASSCGNSVPHPNAPDSEKAAKCDKVSEDQSVGCKACAGFAFCAWKQTDSTDPTSGTCHFVKEVASLPAGMIGDPTHCPAPPQ